MPGGQNTSAECEEHKLYYGVEDKPPWITAIIFGFQQMMVSFTGILITPFIVADLICLNDVDDRVHLIATTIFTSGFSTILQTLCGVRLPLLQGPSFSFLPPIIVLMSLPEFKCKDESELNSTMTAAANESFNFTFPEAGEDDLWMSKMCLIQGGLITASLVQMTIGATGLIGLITRYIGPLTIAPLMILLEISVLPVMMEYIIQHWISLILVGLLIAAALYLHTVKTPAVVYSCKERKRRILWFPFFAMFPYIFAIGITWTIAVILTETNTFNNTTDIYARTDTHQEVIYEAPWIRFPYPGQWGMPRVNLAIFVGMIAGTICSVIESVGDYAACARVSQQPPPSAHAVNRGIFMEGFSCFIGGFLGGSTSVTTYSENVGVIGITRVASRITLVFSGIILILMGLFTKVGAIMATIPSPLIGGILLISMSMVGGVGISAVQLLDMKLSRNMAILGLSIILGLMVPRAVKQLGIHTGIEEIDQALNILLQTEMIVGGLIGFFLDNTVPGATRRQRGLQVDKHRGADASSINHGDNCDVYAYPKPIMDILRRFRWTRYIPISPTFSMARIKPTAESNITLNYMH